MAVTVRAGCFVAVVLCVAAAPLRSKAADATTPGSVSFPYPTIRNISIVWEIVGDDNENGVASVRYRAQGTSTWHDAMPLFRIPAGSNAGFSWTNKHSGSIFDVSPDTTYEIQLTLNDPDGGSTSQTLTAHTRPVPQAPAQLTVVSVTPDTWAKAIQAAVPGTILSLAAGHYTGLSVKASGTAAQPIVIRSASPRSAVIDGNIGLNGLSNIFVENLTLNGSISFADTTNMVIRGCVIIANVGQNQAALQAIGKTGTTNSYVADNVVVGPNPWEEDLMGIPGNNGQGLGEGIQFTGPGNVIEHNYVRGFHDNISLMEGVNSAVNQMSIDILENDIEVADDDAVEADFSMGNVRVMRNRMTNTWTGVSSQPSLGGPTYIMRNAMYNLIYSPFKLLGGSVGDVVLHNTVVKGGDGFRLPANPFYRTYARNNLILGGLGGFATYGGYSNGEGRPIWVGDAQPGVDFDYDGLGAVGMDTFTGLLINAYTSYATLLANTTEKHAVQVDMSVFAEPFEFPVVPFPVRLIPDMSISSGGGAVDAGLPIPNVNDGFSGAAPDLGAYELGAARPSYGPRNPSLRPSAVLGLSATAH